MGKLTVLFLSCLILSLACYSLVFAQSTEEESITFTTYYPAPYGVYRELRAQRMAIGPDYINNPQYCWGLPANKCYS